MRLTHEEYRAEIEAFKARRKAEHQAAAERIARHESLYGPRPIWMVRPNSKQRRLNVAFRRTPITGA